MAGKAPLERTAVSHEEWAELDALRPLHVLGWHQVLFTYSNLPVKRTLWTSDASSPLVDIMDSAEDKGVALVADIDDPRGPGCLHLLYLDNDEIDATPGDFTCLVNPGWKVMCERVKPYN